MRLLVPALLGAVGPCLAVAGQSVSLVARGPDHRPVAGVAVYLPGVRTPLALDPVVVDQRDEAFVPVISVVPVGSEVQFTNSDSTSHHVYSFSKPNVFALPLYKGNARLTQRFLRPGVVVLGCNIHDSMLGYVVVVDSTRSGVTGADGRVTLPDVPPGRHIVRAWAPGLDRSSPPEVGLVEVGDTAPASLAFQVDIAGAVPRPGKRGAFAGADY